MSLEQKGAQHQEVVDKFHDPLATYAMSVRDYTLRPTVVAAAIVVTLPNVVDAKGRFYSIIAKGNVSNTLTVTIQDNDESEDWEGDIVLFASGQGQLFYSDGLKWMLRTFADITVLDINKLNGQIYSNRSDTDFTILKIHNHDTTAEIGGIETKGDLINTTGSVVGEQASWTYEPTGATGAPSGVSASSNVLAVSSGFEVTAGNIYALVGEAQLYGTLNGAAVNVAGVIGVVGGNGANTQVLHMAGIQSAMSTGLVNPTTGTLSYFLANSLSTVVVDNLICSLQSQYITNFASFDAAGTDKCVEVNTNAMTLTNTSYHVRVLIAGNVGYIPVFDAKTWN
uniref:Uncharacterized protein n=3 Tax=viral metagenome TaxID=1070528 RepID=A0A6M3KEI9_9ZZZZ